LRASLGYKNEINLKIFCQIHFSSQPENQIQSLMIKEKDKALSKAHLPKLQIFWL